MLPRLYVRNLLYVLLLAVLLVCSAGHHQGPEPGPDGPYAPSGLHVAVAGAEGGDHLGTPSPDAPSSSGHCHELGADPGPGGPGPGSGAQSSVRLYALVSPAAPAPGAQHASASRPPGSARGGGGGRAALNSLCRWRI